MSVIEILQKIMTDTQRLLTQLDIGASRQYEISTTGTISERTTQMREYYLDVVQQVQRVIDILSEQAGDRS